MKKYAVYYDSEFMGYVEAEDEYDAEEIASDIYPLDEFVDSRAHVEEITTYESYFNGEYLESFTDYYSARDYAIESGIEQTHVDIIEDDDIDEKDDD